MNDDQYKKDMHDAVDAAHKNSWAQQPVTVTEVSQLHKSIDAPVDPERMKDDTIFRTGGECGTNKSERMGILNWGFHQLNQGQDGG